MIFSKCSMAGIGLCWTALLLTFHAEPAQGGPQAQPVADQRVAHALQAANRHYTVTKGGWFQVVQSVAKSPRKQTVVISPFTNKTFGSEWRAVFSIAYEKKQLTPTQLKKLLNLNVQSKRGFWSLYRRNGFLVVNFRVSVPANATGDQLNDAIECVGTTADNMEREVTGKDVN